MTEKRASRQASGASTCSKIFTIVGIVLLVIVTGLDIANVIVTDTFFHQARDEARDSVLKLFSLVEDKVDSFIEKRDSVRLMTDYQTREGTAWTDPNSYTQYLDVIEPAVALDKDIFAVYLGAPNRDVYKIYRDTETTSKLTFEHREYETQKKRSFSWTSGSTRPTTFGSWKDKAYDLFAKGWYSEAKGLPTKSFIIENPEIEVYSKTNVQTYIPVVYPLRWSWKSSDNFAAVKLEFLYKTVNDFLASIKIGSRGKVLLTDSKGVLVAAPDNTKIFEMKDEIPTAFKNVTAYEEGTAVAEALSKIPMPPPAEETVYEAEFDGEPLRTVVMPFKKHGADWRIIVVTFDNDFVEKSLSYFTLARAFGITALVMVAVAFAWAVAELVYKFKQHRARTRTMDRRANDVEVQETPVAV